jgi:hypothetical protein
MLESDLRHLFERQAATDLAPAPISIPAALRIGRTKLRRRRAGAVSSPFLAAGAIGGLVLAANTASGPNASPPNSAAAAAAPASFNPLRPYVRLGWLQTRSPGRQTQLNPDSMVFSWSPANEFIAYSAGQCVVASRVLKCQLAYGAVPSPTRQRLGRQVGRVHGRPAYWNAAGGPVLRMTTGVTSSKGHVTSKTHVDQQDGALAWPYASGGWADVYASSPQVALKIARAADFGPTVAAPLTFPVQLTNARTGWHVDSTDEVRSSGGKVGVIAFSGSAGMPAVSAAPSSGKSACHQALAGATRIRTRDIGGHLVYTFWASTTHPPEWGLCAPDADGLWVYLRAVPGKADRLATLTTTFARMRLLGPNPAHWTTHPIAGR